MQPALPSAVNAPLMPMSGQSDRRVKASSRWVSGLVQVRLVRAGEPVVTQTRIDRFLSSPQRVDVGMIGGQAGRHLGTLGNGAVAGDQDIDVRGGLTQP